ncbi:MAG: hypothetical protein RLZZ618_2803 [Pseudomonadota bacterium]|jgi:3-methylcrotonyl-CoA carboxylase alpha subunit
MFKKILIANRGEIACRVAATARRLGVRTVAVYSDADTNALHVKACDEAVRLGPAAPAESYLSADKIIAAALATGAQAVHPGYGFLSENAGFAEACASAGLVFIGPPAAAIRAMGLKAEAKRLMGEAGVPLVPGYHGSDQRPEVLQQQAQAIGFPVLLKASAGGGGKGMRVVTQAADFAAALAGCQREARSAFGNDDMLIERYLTRPRHIEIQVFADSLGQCVHLFERDCSVQRRHQKVLEESPAPGLSETLRQQMGAAAVAAAKAVGYVGAGTVEFIAEPSGEGGLKFYFMEMNTRLQVEHPVTEAVTDVDLVEWQLRVAAGEPLPRQQHELQLHGHAIEARLCAEHPEQGFLPSTGRLQVMDTPEALSFERGAVRLDTGVQQGDSITPFYDPMIAKLIVWGADRAQALARLDQALARTRIVGLHTNVAFLRRVAASRSFAEADLDTTLIERERTACFTAPVLPVVHAVAAVLAQARTAEGEGGGGGRDPWAQRDGWRLHGMSQQRLVLRVDGEPHTVTVERGRTPQLVLCVAGRRWPLSIESTGLGPHYELLLDGQRLRLWVYGSGPRWTVFNETDSARAEVERPDPALGERGTAPAGGLSAPMPGKVVAVLVAVGQAVTAGQPLAVLEAMKMEHTVLAPKDGTVTAVLCAAGEAVAEGAALLEIADSP